MKTIVALAFIIASGLAAPVEHDEHKGRSIYESIGLSAGPAGYESGLSIASIAGSGGYAAPSAGYSAAGAVHGPAIGIFPSARISGCNVPLLLSCAPNVVSGHLAASSSHAAGAGYSAPAYRSFEEDMRKEEDWMKARKASHHKVSEDFPEPHPGNHHVISQDYPEPNLTRVTPVHSHSEQGLKH